ncbi:MAG: haloacid dehalogenase type II [Halobacteriales archaeon]|nr:haloacid dehalogenase type II [Halobacteriales archaeon]
MSFDPDRVETITFDSFTTLVDVRGSTRRALERHLEDPEPIAQLWRFRAVDYRMVATFVDDYATYYETTEQALRYALAANDVTLSEEAITEIASVFLDLDPFADVRPAMESLDDAGYDLYVVSNGNPAVLEAMVEVCDHEDLLVDTISADEIKAYKPDGRIYEHAAKRTDTPIDRIAHVATPWYDVYGAMYAGMQGVWVNRTGAPWDEFDGDPDLTVPDLASLPAQF